MSYHAMSYHVTLYDVISCYIVSYHDHVIPQLLAASLQSSSPPQLILCPQELAAIQQ